MATPTTAALRSLTPLLRTSDAQGLRDLLRDKHTATALGVRISRVPELVARDDAHLVASLRRQRDRLVAHERRERLLKAESRATEAAAIVSQTARWSGGLAYLDRRVVLGDLLAKPGHLVFMVDEAEVAVSVRLLRRAAKATKVFDDVVVRVDANGFQLRWRGGRGGLNLRPQRLEHRERLEATTVVLDSSHPRPNSVQRQRGAWLRDVIAALAP